MPKYLPDFTFTVDAFEVNGFIGPIDSRWWEYRRVQRYLAFRIFRVVKNRPIRNKKTSQMVVTTITDAYEKMESKGWI